MSTRVTEEKIWRKDPFPILRGNLQLSIKTGRHQKNPECLKSAVGTRASSPRRNLSCPSKNWVHNSLKGPNCPWMPRNSQSQKQIAVESMLAQMDFVDEVLPCRHVESPSRLSHAVYSSYRPMESSCISRRSPNQDEPIDYSIDK